MHRHLTALALTTALAPAYLTAQEGNFSLTAGALSGGFLTQQDQFGFGAGSDNHYANLAYEDATGDFRYRLSLGFDSDDSEILFDDSYIEKSFGHWTIGTGAKDQHWGPSHHASLVLSNNTRPIPGVYVSREAAQSDSRWLSWLGEWYGDVLFGQLGEHTAPEDTKFIGMRLGLAPLPGLDIEFVRMVQFGGVGRDESASTFLKLLAAIGDPNNGSQANQLAGVGVSYTLPKHIVPLRGYFQAVGEDASGITPSCVFYLAGLELSTNIGNVPSNLTLETIDTRLETTAGGNCGPNTAYRNSQYSSGYSHFGATMGAPIDTEGTSITLYGEHKLPNIDFNWSLGKYDINQANLASHRLNPTRSEGLLATVGFTKNWDDSALSGVVAYQGFDLTESSKGVSIGIQFEQKF
jgi:hypothetical protein